MKILAVILVLLDLFQTTASEATLICLLAGRCQAIKNYQKLYPDIEDAEINSRLVAYCSDQAHSSLQKAALIGLVKMRYVESDDALTMRGPKLLQAIKRDREKGLIPFWVRLRTYLNCVFFQVNGSLAEFLNPYLELCTVIEQVLCITKILCFALDKKKRGYLIQYNQNCTFEAALLTKIITN